jgi:hypothetical protein
MNLRSLSVPSSTNTHMHCRRRRNAPKLSLTHSSNGRTTNQKTGKMSPRGLEQRSNSHESFEHQEKLKEKHLEPNRRESRRNHTLGSNPSLALRANLRHSKCIAAPACPRRLRSAQQTFNTMSNTTLLSATHTDSPPPHNYRCK